MENNNKINNIGYTQVYTGNGKGKTTAMLGLTLRACGANKKVFIGQFLKDNSDGEYSEIIALNKFLGDYVDVEQYGSGEGFVDKNNLKEKEISCTKKGYNRIVEILENNNNNNKYDIIILDEINVAVHMNLLTEKEILNIINIKNKMCASTELVLTGRYASESVIKQADLVTEMKEIKHYYNIGVNARTGIEK